MARREREFRTFPDFFLSSEILIHSFHHWLNTSSAPENRNQSKILACKTLRVVQDEVRAGRQALKNNGK